VREAASDIRLDAGLVRRLARSYGTKAFALLGEAKEASDLGTQFGADLHAREVDYLMAAEWALTAEDVLWRRSKLGLRVGEDKARLAAYMAARGSAVGEGVVSGFVLAIDQGTTSSRAIVFDGGQQIAGMGKMEFTQHFPASGWVEHVPEEIWATCCGAPRRRCVRPDSRRGHRRHRHHQPARDNDRLGPGDRQADPQRHRLAGPAHRADLREAQARRQEKMVTRKTGLLLDPISPGTKVKWILDNVKGARKRAERGELAFGTVDTYLIWRLTGGKVHATDATNACRTLLYNIETNDWDDELLKLSACRARCCPR
jgi:hypothetical protein